MAQRRKKRKKQPLVLSFSYTKGRWVRTKRRQTAAQRHRALRRWRKKVWKKARKYAAGRHRRDPSRARIDAINAKAIREGRLKIVDGYYYRRYGNNPYFSSGVGDRQFRYQNGKMIDQHGRVHDWRKEAEEHSAWNRQG